MSRYRCCLLLTLLGALNACSSMPSAAPTGADLPAAAASPNVSENPTPPPEPAEAKPPDQSPEASAPPSASASASTSAANAPCVAPDTVSKPKSAAKHPTRQAPPQPASAAALAGTSPDRALDIEVAAMPASVMSILGKQVHDASGEDLGRVVDVLADARGRVRIAVIDFGGFLGVGDRRIAVDWPLLRFNPGGGNTSLLLSVSRDKLKSAPEYKEGPHPQTLMAPPAPDSAQALDVSAPAGSKN